MNKLKMGSMRSEDGCKPKSEAWQVITKLLAGVLFVLAEADWKPILLYRSSPLPLSCDLMQEQSKCGIYRVSKKKPGSQKISNCSNSLNFEAKINCNTIKPNVPKWRKTCTGLKFDLLNFYGPQSNIHAF